MEICAPATIAIEVYIDKQLCCECGTCIEQCSMGVFECVHSHVMASRSYLCCTCLKCSDFCPTHAINTRWTVRA